MSLYRVETLSFDTEPGRTIDVRDMTGEIEAHEYAVSQVDSTTQPRKAFVYRLNEWSPPILDHIVRQRSEIRYAYQSDPA